MANGLDRTDLKLLAQLLLNSRQPLGLIASKARLSKQNAAYRISRMEKRGMIDSFIALIDYSRLGYSSYSFCFRLRPMPQEQERALIRELLELKVLSLHSCVGEWNLLVVIAADSVKALSEKALRLNYALRGLVLDSEWGIRSKETVLIPPMLLAGAEDEDSAVTLGNSEKKEEADEKDWAILAAISRNARAPFAQLAKVTGIPPETVRYRLKLLESRRIILGYSASLGAEVPLLRPYRVFISFALPTEENIRKVEEYLINLRQTCAIMRRVSKFELSYDIRAKDAAEAREIVDEAGRKFHSTINTQVMLRVLGGHHSFFPKPEHPLLRGNER